MRGMEEIVVLTSLIIFQIFVLNVVSYSLKCPSQANWKLRAQVACNSSLKYFCLYNIVIGEYVEGCNGPDWDRKGSKRIYAGDFSRGYCIKQRYQPFAFWTNGSVSDCIYAKSICSEEGQVVYKDSSSTDDRVCRCDYKKKYAFSKTPRNVCFCIPTKEDCSCYVKTCPVNLTLSADYICTQNVLQVDTKCKEITENNKTGDEHTGVVKEKNTFWIGITTSKGTYRYSTAATLYCLCIIFILVAGGIFFAVLFHEQTNEKLQPLKRYFQKSNLGEGKVAARNLHVDIGDKTTDELNVLRMIHLLFRVACPVVRMRFNHEIQPNQLRRTLYKNKAKMEKRYRKKERIINNYQWDLLFRRGKVSSDDFDIGLMIYLLETLADIKVGNFYPVPSDMSIGAMLSRIRYIRNETTRICEEKLPQYKCNQYWDDIGQALLKLMSSHKIVIDYNQEKIRLIGRLLALNPITIDNKKLCIFIDMSERYPAMILQQFISEYCKSKQLTIEDILREEKHQLYHKRIKTVACCECTKKCSSYRKVIPEKHWKVLYEISMEVDDSHYCRTKLQECITRFVPKRIYTFDVFVAMTIILNIPNMLNYMISQLLVNGFEKFLIQNQHTLYHSMERNKCCKCNNVPTEKILVDKKEWNSLFYKDDNMYCKTGSKDCCCQYSVRTSIKYSNVDDFFLSKIFFVAGPFGFLNKIEQDAFSYFLNWTVDDQPLISTLTELLRIIKDQQFCRRNVSPILSQSHEAIATQTDARKWASRHLRQHKATTEHQRHIIVHDEDGLTVKNVQIPKDFPLTHIPKKFSDLTPEENNFVLVFYGLKKIVYPVIKKEFDTKCPDPLLHRICMGSYKVNKHSPAKNNQDNDNSRKENIYLTQFQRVELLSANGKERRNIDLKLMIHILKQRSKEEEKADYDDQLDVVDNIRREIVQSSSGVLNEKRFHEILNCIRMAVLHLGGELYEEKILHLRHVKHILE